MRTAWVPLELGHSRLDLGLLTVDWFDGGGYVESHLVWRVAGVPIAIVLAGEA